MTMAQGREMSSEHQQKWMQRRVQFQALAIVIVIIILLAAGASRG
jgi:hypothetical protein